MSGRRGVRTALVAVVLAAVGFAAGAGGSAWQTREVRADPWRKLRVEHQGTEGMATRTRVVFENPKLPLQAVELLRSPEGAPELARIALRDGAELTANYVKDPRPSSLLGPDGSKAMFAYKGDKARVAFVTADGKTVGDKVLTVPVELRSPLRLGQAATGRGRAIARLWRALADQLVGEAWAQDGDEDKVAVRRDVVVQLEVRVPSAKGGEAGSADVEATCPPYTCLPMGPEPKMPGQSAVRIGVTASAKRSALAKPSGAGALSRFEQEALDERHTASAVLPDVATAVAAVGVAALACKSLKLAWPLCVPDLNRTSTSAAGAVHGISWHEVETRGPIVDKRAEELYYEAQARAALDREVPLQLCVSRAGYARACTKIDGRPFGPKPMAPVARSVELRRGIGGTLEGSFVISQADGADCKFSPSPRTTGTLKLSFDNERHTATATLKANDRGTRPNLRCSLGTANMGWSQTYGVTASQSFTAEQLQSGGKLPLRLTGTMNGTGGYSFSNCRSNSGVSGNCPAGKSDSYSYRVEILGELDLDTQRGQGRIVVHDAPLPTSGTWQIPADETP